MVWKCIYTVVAVRSALLTNIALKQTFGLGMGNDTGGLLGDGTTALVLFFAKESGASGGSNYVES